MKIHSNVSNSSLLAAGCPGKHVRLFQSLDMSKACCQFALERYDENGNSEKVPVMPRKQLEWLNRCYEDTYHGAYTCYLSDFQNGDIARTAAVSLISHAIAGYNLGKGRKPPKWIRLNQSFDPQFERDSTYSFLVIDNVFVDSTSVKIEKLRDLMSANDSTPTVIIVSSPGEPLALSHKFSLTATYGILLRNTRQVVEEEAV